MLGKPCVRLFLGCVLLCVEPCFSEARATALIVPDQASTVGSALSAFPDTVYLRPAKYRETPVVSYPIVLLSLEGGSVKPSLEGLVIQVAPNRTGSFFAFRNIAILGALEVLSDNGNCDLDFTDCELRGGLVDYSQYGDTRTLSFVKCQLDGFFDLWANTLIQVNSCHVSGGVSANGPGPDLEVRGNVFEGNDSGYALRGERLSKCDIVGNQVHRYSSGVAVSGDYTTISDNIVTDCWTMGIGAGVLLTTIANNTVERCGRGILAEDAGRGTVKGNRVSSCAGEGIYISGVDRLDLLENVVWNCGSDGVLIRGAGSIQLTVKRNTICSNRGSAYVVEDSYSVEEQEWSGNIAYLNEAFAVRWLSGGAARFSCNDWVGNQLGAVAGLPPSGEDLSVDPSFCEPDSGDFRLQAGSPLLGDSATCGQIGALGVGCGATPTLVERFGAERVTEGVRVVWVVAKGATASAIGLERSEGSAVGPWTRPVTERSSDGRGVVEVDQTASAEQVYWYRLVAQEGASTTAIAGPLRVDAQAPLEFRLREVGPNPGSGPLRIVFALKKAAAIEIDVFDIQGRRVASPGRGNWLAGTHEVVWGGRSRNGQPVPAGLYVVRYVYPGGHDRRAIVMVN